MGTLSKHATSLRKVIGNVFPFKKVFWSISRPPMADLVRVIQTPKQAMMVSLLSDSTCPTLKVGERAFPYFLVPESVFLTFEARVTSLAHPPQQAPKCLTRTQT